MAKIYYESELYHHGVKGQKWGLRRYQNPDGTLTELGRKRLSSWQSKEKTKIAERRVKQIRKEDKAIARRQDAYNRVTKDRGDDAARKAVNKLAESIYKSAYNERLAKAEVDKIMSMSITEAHSEAVKVGATQAGMVLLNAGSIAVNRAGLTPMAFVGWVPTNKLKTDMRITPEEKQKISAEAYADSITETIKAMYGNSGTLETGNTNSSKTTKTNTTALKSESEIAEGFKENRWGNYTSDFKATIGDAADVNVSVRSTKGKEKESAKAATEFLKKYDTDKAREGLAKEYYDGKYSDEWLDKNPNSSNYTSRDDLKSKAVLNDIDIHPEWNTYTAYWYDGGTYGGHTFVDEGNMDDMKVKYRSLEG